MLAHKGRNPINDEDDEDDNVKFSNTVATATFDLDDDEVEVYYTNTGDDQLTPRFDFDANSVDSVEMKPPPLIHANTIRRLCPDIEITHTIGAAGSMKIASKLLNIAADARRSLLHSASLKPIEEEPAPTPNLSTPSVLKWLRKVSYLVSALSSMESTELSQQPPSPSPIKYKNDLFRITEKAWTPSDLKEIADISSGQQFLRENRFRLDDPDPLIQLFTIGNIPTTRKQQLYTRVSGPTISRLKRHSPQLLNGGQSRGYKMDEGDETSIEDQQKVLETTALRKHSVITRSVVMTTKRNPKQLYDTELPNYKSPTPLSRMKDSRTSGKNLPAHNRASSLSDSIDGDSESKNNSRDNHQIRIQSNQSPDCDYKNTTLLDEADPESLFINDTNPLNGDIDNFDATYGTYSHHLKHNHADDPVTVSKLHSNARSTDQYDHFSVEITRPLKIIPSLPQDFDVHNLDVSTPKPEQSSPINSIPRNPYAVVDTRRVFSAKSTKERIDHSPEYHISKHMSYNPESSRLKVSTQPIKGQQPVRPISTGSISMDQFYTKQYNDQLTQNLVTESVVSCASPNSLKIPSHRSQSAQQYRKLRSPPSGLSRPPKSSSSSLPIPSKPIPQTKKENIFLNSGRNTEINKNKDPSSPLTRRQYYGENTPLFSGGNLDDSIFSTQAHYMENTGHLSPETYDGVQRSLRLVTYFTDDNYRLSSH